MKSWVEVSEQRLAENFATIAHVAGAGTQVLAVVKANAYGHGAEVCSVALSRAGAAWLGVADAAEGARVRRALTAAGTAARILLMCGLMPEAAASIAEHRLTPVVWTLEQVGWLRACPAVPVHVEIDTGMGRQGVREGAQLDTLLQAIAEAGIQVEGLCTHFCEAEVAHSARTQAQQRRFEEAVTQAHRRGVRPRWLHAGSSSSIDNPAQSSPWLAELAASVGAQAMVRCGIALYGYCLPISDPTFPPHLRPALKPVMTWKTRILDVRSFAAGDTIGYNASFIAERSLRVALLPVGYADGLRRGLSSTNGKPGGWVMVHGHRAPILGRISMNLTMVDVTGLDAVFPGDEAILLGEGITADHHAQLAGTIPYEILCAVRAGECAPAATALSTDNGLS